MGVLINEMNYSRETLPNKGWGHSDASPTPFIWVVVDIVESESLITDGLTRSLMVWLHVYFS